MDFLLALLTPAFMDTARTKIYKLLGRYNLGAMYLHEFARLFAMVVAVPRILSDDCDVSSDVVVMLQVIQVLTASWRRAIGVHPSDGRERAAAVLQLSFSLLAPMYAALKPLDPQTKKAGVLNLYVHASLSHVRQSVGQAFPTLAMVCHDNIEGTIAEMNRNVHRRTNNVSRWQVVANKQALDPLEFLGVDERSVTEQMLFTREIVACPCLCRVGFSVIDDVNAVMRYASREPSLSVTVDPYAPLPAAAEVDRAHATVAAATAATEADAIATDAAVAAAAAGTAPVAVEDSATAADTAEAVATTAKQAAATASDTAAAALLELVGVVPLLLSLDAEPDTLKKDNTHNL